MKRKVSKVLLSIVIVLLLVVSLLTAVILIRQSVIDNRINDDYDDILNNVSYHKAVSINEINYITQEISCGYAIIEMLSNWENKGITEQGLFEKNKSSISTAMGKGFLNEMTEQFPEWQIERYVNLTNSELLKIMYETLSTGMPVPIEFAAIRNINNGDFWTLHFALVTGMDLEKDIITLQNPYGYEEQYTVDDFLLATRFESYDNMEFYLKLGFGIGLFNKNTIYTIQKK